MITRERLIELTRHRMPYVRDMARELLATRWRPITAEDLPKVGDELLMFKQNILGDHLLTAPLVTLFEWRSCDAADLKRIGWTHFRAINPPERKEQP